MTYDEAISIRSQQLSGQAVNPFDAALALSVIQSGKKEREHALHCGGKPRQVLEQLIGGPVERSRFFERITDGHLRKNTPYEAFRRLQKLGLVKCEVKLTEAGLRALGLEGPR